MERIKIPTWALVIAIAFSLPILDVKSQAIAPPFLEYVDSPWVDSIMTTLSIEEKIAQSIWVAAYSNKEIDHEVEIVNNIKDYGIGGILFFQGSVDKQVELINYYQSISKVPIIFSMDAEWGIGMRLSEIEPFPFQMTIGAIDNDSLIYQMGRVVADQCKLTGIQVNFAPVADINNNASNPVINYRSFGEDRARTAQKAFMYMQGMQDNHVLSTAKHFPGHGDTNTDSHLDLPLIQHPRERIDSLELFPFKYLINKGIGGVMTAHLNIPALDTTANLPSTLSKAIISDLLKGELNFQGLVVTDAMNMKGVTKYHKNGEAEAKALLAGNDVVEYVSSVEATITETKKLVDEGTITIEQLDNKCRKILALKYWTGLYETKKYAKGVTDEINSNKTKALIREIYANALTVLNNEQNIIPLRGGQKVAAVIINGSESTLFSKRLTEYQQVDTFRVNSSDSEQCSAILNQLADYDVVIAGVFGLSQRPANGYGVTKELSSLLSRLTNDNKVIVTWFGNPYPLANIESLKDADGLLLAYQDNPYVEDVAAQLVFGGLGAKGTLPVTINERWRCGYGIVTPGNVRLQYGYPESAGLSSRRLEQRIDSIVNKGLSAKAFPGCSIIAAKDGIVIFNKTYGYHEFDGRIAVEDNDLYDLASVTKISSTLPALMYLESIGEFSTNEKMERYIPFLKGSDKGELFVKDVLTHQAGLTPTIPFWREGIKGNGKFLKRLYSLEPSTKYPLKVADGLYTNDKSKRVVVKDIVKSPLGEQSYLYSDLGFIMLPMAVESITEESFESFVTDNIYAMIGADDMMFNPWKRYPRNMLVPTEYDSLFRRQQLQGTVHDEAAALLGGVSGHAGLFANGNDLLKLMELYRRGGSYGGTQLIDPQVIKNYTTAQFPENGNRRGLGFDKPLLNNNEVSPEEAYPCKGVSPSSFGHSGFTGTFVWVDPEYGLSYVFLCNRVYPTRNNTSLSKLNIRTDILQAFYDSEGI